MTAPSDPAQDGHEADQAQSGRVLAERAWTIAAARNATDPIALDVSPWYPFSDVFLLVTASSDRNARAIAEAVEEGLADIGVPVRRREGRDDATWVLVDFGPLVLHVFQQRQRDYYALERIWREASVVPLPEVPAAAGPGADRTAAER